jgi:hypothetical protein
MCRQVGNCQRVCSRTYRARYWTQLQEKTAPKEQAEQRHTLVKQETVTQDSYKERKNHTAYQEKAARHCARMRQASRGERVNMAEETA